MVDQQARTGPVTLAAKVTSASLAHDAWAGEPYAVDERRARAASRLVAFGDDDYPTGLRTIEAPPAHLYVIGPVNQPGDDSAVAVVGSRQASVGGTSAATGVARKLAAGGHTIVSGLAAGVDAASYNQNLWMHHLIEGAAYLPR